MHRSLRAAALLLAALGLALPAHADGVKIGYLATLTGNGAIFGRDMLDGFNLAVKQAGGRLGGLPTQIIVQDDQEKPEIGRQLADKLVEADKVDIIVGLSKSTVLLAVARPVLDAGVFIIGTNAGPSQLAGKGCNQNLFITSWQNDNSSEAMGKYLHDQGVKSAYLMAPNFPAGKDKLTGFKRFFQGNVVAEVYTQFGQLDYAAQLAELRAAKPEALYFFYQGGMGINFLKQLDQSGLKKTMRVTAEMADIDQSVLPAVGEAAMGIQGAVFWSERMQNPANVAFVKQYEAEYHRIPSPFSAQAYDAGRLLDAALRQSGGVADKAAFRRALLAAKFDSVRGNFAFNRNHFPIQDWYLAQPVKVGDHFEVDVGAKVMAHYGDAYVDACPLKPGE